MSRLWAFTCIILALGIGLLAGILVVMYVFVLPRSETEKSKFLKNFPMQEMLQAASPKDTQWDILDNGSEFRGFRNRGPLGRRWLVECKMPNAADQTSVSTLLTSEIHKSMTPYGGVIYSLGVASRASATTSTAPGPAGPATAAPATAVTVLYQTTFPYGLKEHTGFVHLTVFGQGDRIMVSVIVQED